MKKEIKKIDGKISVTNGITTARGFKNWSEARKFLKFLEVKNK